MSNSKEDSLLSLPPKFSLILILSLVLPSCHLMAAQNQENTVSNAKPEFLQTFHSNIFTNLSQTFKAFFFFFFFPQNSKTRSDTLSTFNLPCDACTTSFPSSYAKVQPFKDYITAKVLSCLASYSQYHGIIAFST